MSAIRALFLATPLLLAGLVPVSGQKATDPAATGSIQQRSAGGIFGILNETLNPSLATYLSRNPVDDFASPHLRIEAGHVIPPRGPAYREIPGEYDFDKKLRLTRINGKHLVVDPATRLIVEVLP